MPAERARLSPAMTVFSMPVGLYLSRPVKSVLPGDNLERARELLAAFGISALAVTDEAEQELLGVVTRTDLLRVGRSSAGERKSATLLSLPDIPVEDVMQKNVLTVHAESSVREAARLMVEHHVHRLFVTEDRKLSGVLSTKDVMVAISDERLTHPISELMTQSVLTVEYDDPASLAAEKLEQAHVSGLVVVEDEWPIGVFTQEEALESRDMPTDTPVEEVLSPAMLCLNAKTPIHRAAAHAAAMDVRRIIAVQDKKLVGILTGIDLCRAAAS